MKKYAIANLTAPTIAAILDGNDPKLAGSMALLAILLYSLQQYADFSGGIDMVLGVYLAGGFLAALAYFAGCMDA